MSEIEQKYFDEVSDILSAKGNIDFLDRPKLTKLRASLGLSVERALELEGEAKAFQKAAAKELQEERERQLAEAAADAEKNESARGNDLEGVAGGEKPKDKPTALHWALLISAVVDALRVFMSGHWLVGLVLAVFPIVLITPFSGGDRKSHNALGWILSVGSFFLACDLAIAGHWFWAPIVCFGAVILLAVCCSDLEMRRK